MKIKIKKQLKKTSFKQKTNKSMCSRIAKITKNKYGALNIMVRKAHTGTKLRNKCRKYRTKQQRVKSASTAVVKMFKRYYLGGVL